MTTLLQEADLQPGVRWVDNCWQVVPAHLGPTWEKAPPGTPKHLVDPGGYILPELTLGWQILKWIRENLLSDDLDEYDNPLPFRPTPEQARFILWWYAIDTRGVFLYNEGVLQRLKGWGKDPLVAVLSAVEFVGPCRFAGWASDDMPDIAVYKGDPVAKECPRAWVQIAAVAKKQTANTSLLLNGLFAPHLIKKWSIDPGIEMTKAQGGMRQIQNVTASPDVLEGNRSTFVVKNETQHWKSNNRGHDMADAIERNLVKSKDGAARSLSITNAYEPSQDSVGQRERESWERQQAGLAPKTGSLYDSLEAPHDAMLRPPKESKDAPEATEDEIKAYIGAIVAAVRGDSTWLNVERIVDSILSDRNTQSRSRRFFYNQVNAAEDSWVDPLAVEAAISALAAESRRMAEYDQLRAGWSIVLPTDECVMFFDGSKSDDATAIVACRLDDGYVFTIGVWERPPKARKKEGWVVPRDAVDDRVREAMKRFNIVAFWADPSHAKDDVEATSYWSDIIDTWHRDFRERLQAWPTKTGNKAHSILFDMSVRWRTEMFVEAAETFIEEIEHIDDYEEYDPMFQIDGFPALVLHMRNAKKMITEFGTSLMKINRESQFKIDLAVCAVGARMLRRVVLNKGPEKEKEKTTGVIWH